jgi:FdhD protein
MMHGLPRLSRAQAALTHPVTVVNEFGEQLEIAIPAEHALTIYVDKHELVTLMTLGAQPEWLALGYLLNQRLVHSAMEVESVTVDWDVGAVAVKTHHGIADLAARVARKVVTTGCGQGSVFGDWMDSLEHISLPASTMTQGQLYAIVNTIRLQQSVYKAAGSVHGCALFSGDELLLFVEDVGRHNAIDTIAGWMALNGVRVNGNLFFYTTGRLTSEMVIKAAQMGIAVVISRSGTTQMGQTLAQRLGLCAIGRATHKRFYCFSAAHRLVLQPELAGARLRAVA